MYHFFVKPEQISGDRAVITGPDVNHIGNVLRMKPGEKVLLSAGEDWEYLCGIEEITKEEVRLTVFEENRDVRELPASITLWQGLPKSDKMELIVQKAVELGVSRIVPVETKRCIVKLDPKKAENRVRRWQAIAESAAKQSGRHRIPEVGMPVSFREALKEASSDQVRLIPYELAEGMDATRKIIEEIPEDSRISVFIGPEGGFEETEIREAEALGFRPVTLGKRILRTETAGLVILSFLLLKLEN